MSDLLDEFALSAKLPLTLGLLFSRPGFLSSEWRVGRRARYVSALRVYILASIVFFSVTFFVGLPIIGELELGFDDLGTEIAGNAGQLVNTVIARRMQGFLTLGAALSVPLLALWVKLLRRRSEILYVDHLVLSLHLHFYDLALLLVPFAIVCHHYPGLRGGRPLDAGPLLALTLALWGLGFAGASLSLAQLRVSEALGMPAVAVQLTPLVVVAWGGWLLREAREAS